MTVALALPAEAVTLVGSKSFDGTPDGPEGADTAQLSVMLTFERDGGTWNVRGVDVQPFRLVDIS